MDAKTQENFESTILDLIDTRDDYTRSDLQALVTELVERVIATVEAQHGAKTR